MDCEYYLELISREADGELSEQESAALSAHLAECEACRRFAAALQAIHAGLAEEAEVPAGFAESLMAKLPGRKKNVIPFRRWGSLAAAAVLAVALGSSVFAPKGKEAAMAAPMAPAAGESAPAAAAPAEAQMENNDIIMFAAPRAKEAKAMESAAADCAEAEATEEAAFDPRSEAALAYAAEKLPGYWEILSAEGEVFILCHESGEELQLRVNENGEVSE